MAFDAIGEAHFDIIARMDKLEADLKRAQSKTEKAAKGMEKSFGRVDKSIGRMGNRLKAAASVASLALLVRASKRATTALDNIGKTASKLGLTTDALQEMRAAAESAGVAQNTFDMAIQRFGRRLAEARQDTGEAKDALKELKIELFNADGSAKSIEDTLDDVSDSMSGMAEQTDKNRIAMKLFDSEGVVMVNFMGKGSAKMNEMRAAARELGVVIDAALIRKAEKAKTELDLMSRVIDAKMGPALVELAPIILQLTGLFADFISTVADGTKVIRNFLGMRQLTLSDQLVDEQQRLKGIYADIQRFEKEAAEADTGSVVEGVATRAIEGAKIKAQAQLDTIIALQKQIEGLGAGPAIDTTTPISRGGGDAPEEEELGVFAQVMANARQELNLLNNEMNLLGKSEEVIVSQGAAWEMLSEIYKEFGVGVADLQEAIDEGLLPPDFRDQINDLANEIGATTVELDQQTAAVDRNKEALEGLSEAFRSSAVNAARLAIEGASLKEVLLSLITSILNSQGLQNYLFNLAGVGGSTPAAGSGGLVASFFGAVKGLFGFAEGGRPPVGQPVVVGEKGPEIAVFDSPARIYSATDSVAMMSAFHGAPQRIGAALGDIAGPRLAAMSPGGSAYSSPTDAALAGPGGGVTVNQYITTPDVGSFRRHSGQLQADAAAQARSSGMRNN